VPGELRIAVLGPLEVRTGSGLPVDVAGARLRRRLLRLAPVRLSSTAAYCPVRAISRRTCWAWAATS
jgi:hypothetical protein